MFTLKSSNKQNMTVLYQAKKLEMSENPGTKYDVLVVAILLQKSGYDSIWQ